MQIRNFTCHTNPDRPVQYGESRWQMCARFSPIITVRTRRRRCLTAVPVHVLHRAVQYAMVNRDARDFHLSLNRLRTPTRDAALQRARRRCLDRYILRPVQGPGAAASDADA